MSLVKNDQNSVTYIEGMPLLEYCKFISNSQLIPKNYKGKVEDIFLAIVMGKEIGLKPLQALKSISVINSIANIYGDAAISLVQSHPQFEDIKEYFDEKLQGAVCIIKRKHQSEHTVIYSIEDAKKAGLWGKPGPWQQYPKRMLQMRARSFALRDRFADALGGLILAEEAQDYPIDVTPRTRDLNSRLDILLDKNMEKDNSSISSKMEHVIQDDGKEVKESHFASQEYQDLAVIGIKESTFAPKEYQDLVMIMSGIPEDLRKKWEEKWCKAADVENIGQLNKGQLKKCIEFVQAKYSNTNIAYGVEIIDIEEEQ